MVIKDPLRSIAVRKLNVIIYASVAGRLRTTEVRN